MWQMLQFDIEDGCWKSKFWCVRDDLIDSVLIVERVGLDNDVAVGTPIVLPAVVGWLIVVKLLSWSPFVDFSDTETLFETKSWSPPRDKTTAVPLADNITTLSLNPKRS